MLSYLNYSFSKWKMESSKSCQWFFFFMKSCYDITFIHFDFASVYMLFSFKISSDSFLFLTVIMLISLSVMKFSLIYMQYEVMLLRFTKLVLFFIMSMLILILSNSFFIMIVGWDLLGLSSYSLILYYQSWKSFSGASITLMINRLGDALMLMSLVMYINNGDFSINMKLDKDLSFLTFLLVMALFTKSAQIPFVMWLPEAMEAPTPVSALVHSSTLVTSGIYMLISLFSSLEEFIYSYYMLLLSLLTMVIGGLTGIIVSDSKKLVALSTLSQLGFMVNSIFLGYENVAFFHVLCHAIFKALLFIIIGIEINFKFHEQNMKKFNNKLMMNNLIYLKLISLLSLNAFPFFSGYYSKDMIFQLNLMTESMVMASVMIFAISLTILYSIKLWSMSDFFCFSYFNFNKYLLKLIYIKVFLGSTALMMGNLFIEFQFINIAFWEHWLVYISIFLSIIMIKKEKKMLQLMYLLDNYKNSFYLMKLIPKFLIKPSLNYSNNVIIMMEMSMNEMLFLEIKNNISFILIEYYSQFMYKKNFMVTLKWMLMLTSLLLLF